MAGSMRRQGLRRASTSLAIAVLVGGLLPGAVGASASASAGAAGSIAAVSAESIPAPDAKVPEPTLGSDLSPAVGADDAYARPVQDVGKATTASSESMAPSQATELVVQSAATGNATAVAVGNEHACAFLATGNAACWGRNDNGQLGTGVQWLLGPWPSSPTPVLVYDVYSDQAPSIAAGAYHTCAAVASGSVKCWGWNAYGQVGVAGSPDGVVVPTLVSGVANATAVAAGGSHSCALISDGTIRCWGLNDHGQLGNGTFTNSSTPVTVTGVSTATSIAASDWGTCAMLASGAMQCWGRNDFGQLGNGSTTDSSIPVTVAGVSNVVVAAPGNTNSCAVISGGTVKCWGRNSAGQLGNGTTTDSLTAVTVSGISTATTAASRAGHTCSRLTDGTLRCWGANLNAELGNGTAISSSVPVQVVGITSATSVAVGDYSACAVLTAGTVGCWGWSGEGQLGDGGANLQVWPVTAAEISTATHVATGYSHSCATLANGTLRCWGDNTYSQLGDGSTVPSTVPVAVAGITTATDVAASNYSTCALLANQTVSCWGDGLLGQIGNGSGASASTPTQVTGLSGVIALDGGGQTFCAVVSGGTVKCWGNGQDGQLGNGTIGTTTTPVQVTGISSATSVSVGVFHACALLAAGTVTCWGWGGWGQLGNGGYSSSTVPVVAGSLSGAIGVSAGRRHTCAWTGGEALWCWGDRTYLQVFDGTSNRTPPIPNPYYMGSVPSVTTVAAGWYHTCVGEQMGADTGRSCWGNNSFGQTANGLPWEASTPQGYVMSSAISELDAAYAHTCARMADGTVTCWGDNEYGQSGNAFAAPRTTPVQAFGLGAGSLPGAPGTATGTPVNTGVTVTWPNTATDGGAPITAFTVTANPGGRTCTTHTLSCTVTGLTNGTPYTFTLTATNSIGTGPASGASAGISPSGGTYVAITPNRLLDSRSGNGFLGALSVGVPRTFQVTGRNLGNALLNVPANAVAVTGNLTVTGATEAGWLTLEPTPEPAPPTSTINFPVGDSRANGVTVPLGPGGTLSIVYNGPAAGNTTHAIFDVTGYFLPDLTGATYVKVTPNRLLDSRFANGFSGPLSQGASRSFQVTNRNSGNAAINVPSNAIAVTGNLTVTQATQDGWVSITPNLDNNPGTSTLNFPAGDNRANGVTAPLGTGGILSLAYNSSYCCSNTVHVIFDVTGYFVPGTSGAKYQPIIPNRLLDSRFANGFSGALGVSASKGFATTDRNSPYYWYNVPANAIAVTGNLTVTGQTADGWLSLTPTQDNNPPTSTLNFPVGDTRANGVAAPLGSGQLWVAYNGPVPGNTANAIFDVTGYFVP